jgi:hypothetical protein
VMMCFAETAAWILLRLNSLHTLLRPVKFHFLNTDIIL